MNLTGKLLLLTGMAATLGMAGCHGNNDRHATPAALTGAEGVYTGTVSTGAKHLSLVLENGDFYVLYPGPDTSGITGFLRGAGTSKNGAFTATDVRDYSTAPSAGVTKFNGHYVAGASLNATLASTHGSVTYAGIALNDARYAYSANPSLAAIVGTWNLTDMAGGQVTLTFGTDGRFTGMLGKCPLSGTLAPRATGKNVFDFSFVYGPAPCSLPNQAIGGAAVVYRIGTKLQFIAAGTDATRANGIAFIGTK